MFSYEYDIGSLLRAARLQGTAHKKSAFSPTCANFGERACLTWALHEHRQDRDQSLFD